MRRLPKVEVPKHPDLRFELPLWESGLTIVAGLDEAGRGAWAGPVAAGAVILPSGAPGAGLLERLHGVRDSKVMTSRQRTVWAEQIRLAALAWGVGFAECHEVDTLGIVPATRLAMERALTACNKNCAAPVGGRGAAAGGQYSTAGTDQGGCALAEHCRCQCAGKNRTGCGDDRDGRVLPRIWVCHE